MADLGSTDESAPINTPRESKDITKILQLRSAYLTAGIPKPNGAITGAACKLEIFHRIEQNLLNRMSMAS